MHASNGHLSVSPDDHALLVKWSKSRTLPTRLVVRSRIVLMLANGESVNSVARELGVARATVELWRRRFCEQGPAGLERDAPGRGRKPALALITRQELRSPHGARNGGSVRAHARELGVSPSTVSRWRRRRD